MKKKDYTAKISEIEEKYIATSDYNKSAKETLDARIKQKKLVRKSDISLKFCYITLKMLNVYNTSSKSGVKSRATENGETVNT